MKFIAEDDKLTITMQGWEIVWSLRRKLVLPRSSITDLTWTPQFDYDGNLIFRLGGTGLPGLLYAGNFRGAGEWIFLFVRRPKGRYWFSGGNFSAANILDISTQDYPYRRLMLTCNEDIGVSLMNWWSATR